MIQKSGPIRLQLRLPQDLHEKIKSSSDISGRSINAEILFLIDAGLRGDSGSKAFEVLSDSDKEFVMNLISTIKNR